MPDWQPGDSDFEDAGSDVVSVANSNLTSSVFSVTNAPSLAGSALDTFVGTVTDPNAKPKAAFVQIGKRVFPCARCTSP